MSENERITRLMEQIVALPSIEGQRALYDTLSPEDQATMDARGVKRMWRSRRSSEAHVRRRKVSPLERALERSELDPEERRRRDVEHLSERVARAPRSGFQIALEQRMAQDHAAGKHDEQRHSECEQCDTVGGDA